MTNYRQIKQLSSIDINLFVYLAAILQERHISKAAEALNISQATMSYHLGKLRKQLNDPLLIQGKGGMKLSNLAQQIEQDLGQWLVLTQQLTSGHVFDPATSKGSVSIGMEDISASIVIPRLMEIIHLEAPGIRLEHITLNHVSMEQALNEGVDMVVGKLKSAPADVHAQYLMDSHLVAVTSKNHRLANRPHMSLTDVLDQPLLCFDMPGEAGTVLDKMFKQHASVEIMLRSKSVELLRKTLLQGQEFMILPSTLIDVSFKRCDFKVWPLEEIEAMEMYCYWTTAVHNDPMVTWLRRKFVQVLLQIKAELNK